jgi:2,4-diketo-3-deoxy-L-fuconate hydrolase
MRLVTYNDWERTRVGVVGHDMTVTPVDDLLEPQALASSPATMLAVIGGWELVKHRLIERARDVGGGILFDDLLDAEATPYRHLGPPIRPFRNVFCVGWNYAEHFAEGRAIHSAAGHREMPEHPAFFTKQPSAIVPHEAGVWHPGERSSELDWEVELAVVIGTWGRDIPESRALDHVFGYTIGNDVSVRDHQRSRHGGQWFKGKSFDTHCPLGPWIVTVDEIPDPQTLRISSLVNGVTKQDSNTRHMVFSVARIIAELSVGMSLHPGDVILTGTPEGVGFARTPPEFLKVGDVMEMEIERIGVLRNRVATYGGAG